MAVIGYPEILLAILSFLFLSFWNRRRSWHENSLPTNWPLVGMLPALLRNRHCVHEFVTQLMKQSGHTFEFKGPWFGNMDMVVTSDPANLHYILSKNFPNFPKGPAYKKIFDVLGDGILNSDSDSWRIQRKIIHSLFKHARFQRLLQQTTQQRVEKRLIPVLEYVAKLGIEVDMQDVFQRFTFDNVCLLVLGFDSSCLSIEFPEVPFEKAFGDIEAALFRRHLVPENYWKLQKWLQIGEEKKLSRAFDSFDHFFTQCISLKREEQKRSKAQMEEDEAEEGFDLLTAYTEEEQLGDEIKISDKFLRDTALNLMAAGRDTVSAALTWFIWLIATNPTVEIKIIEEIKANLKAKEDEKCWLFFSGEELSSLIYLHASLCESLRLFPSVPINHKVPVQPDILPSGHRVDQNSKMLLSFYSMGRMEEIWGEDCLEFKPERWISEGGGIIHVPSHKFAAFNAGPRSCLGKEMTFIQMKIIATAIICNYHVQVVEGHPVSPCNSVVLHMKHGLKVRVTKRCV